MKKRIGKVLFGVMAVIIVTVIGAVAYKVKS